MTIAKGPSFTRSTELRSTKEYTEIDTSGDYAMIKLIDTYNQAAEPFGYTMPGPDTTITITFTVSGW